MRLLWLADELRKAGLKVVEEPGWKTRGSAFSKDPMVFIYHHMVVPISSGNVGGKSIVVNGRARLPGPIANLVLARDGTVWVVASGVSNNAGKGNARYAGLPKITGNANTIAMEMVNNGVGEPYSPAMYTAAIKVGAVIAKMMNWPVSRFINHKDWSTTGKIDSLLSTSGIQRDISLVMNASVLAKEVQDDMDGNTPITQAKDVAIAGIPGGTIVRPFTWWLSANYAHLLNAEAAAVETNRNVKALLAEQVKTNEILATIAQALVK